MNGSRAIRTAVRFAGCRYFMATVETLVCDKDYFDNCRDEVTLAIVALLPIGYSSMYLHFKVDVI
eukprot:IDg12449t1